MAPTLILRWHLLLVPAVIVQSFHLQHPYHGLLGRAKTAATTTTTTGNLVLPRFASSEEKTPQSRRRQQYYGSGSILVTPLFLSSDPQQQDDEEVEIVEISSSTTSTSSNSTTATTTSTSSLATTAKKAAQKLWVKLNDLGAGLKPKAQKATAKGYEATTKSAQFGYGLQACLYYSLFILYRAYRGLFVLLPAVFKQVYVKMEEAMQSSDMALVEAEEELMPPSDDGSVVYKPKKQMWRTRLTVSALASVVTMSYMIGGTVQMATRFFKTLTKSSSVTKSFEAAADGMVDYESKIGKIGGGGKSSSSTTGINGDTDTDELTP
jgi:hypothetical protein